MLINQTIKFGTDGWRAVIADGFDHRNVRRVSQATVAVAKKRSKSRLIVVGYDNRFMSDTFARTAAEVFAGNGMKVELSAGPLTSPALSFHTKARKAALGVMITASHNPPAFNGFKIKGVHGGSVDESVTAAVEGELDNDVPRIGDAPAGVDFVRPYVAWLKKLAPPRALSRLKAPVVFDAMHGPGGDIMRAVVGKSDKIVFMRDARDPLFGGVNPEPIETNLSLLKEAVVRRRAAAGIAVDGDADRIGLVDDKGRYIPPHTVMPLILQHLITGRRMKGKVVQTVSMGYLPGRIAAKFRLDFEEVPVGFKYVAERIARGRVLMGGEESGGYGVGLWSPERDGLLCALLIVELLAIRKKPLSAIIDALQAEFGASHFRRVDFDLPRAVDKKPWTDELAARVQTRFAGRAVKRVNPLDGLKIILDDDSWVLMRPSGTEPLLRTYAESPSTSTVAELLSEAERLVKSSPGMRAPAPDKKGAKRRAKKKP